MIDRACSGSVVNRLAGLAGNTLLTLKKPELQKLLEPLVRGDEIWRLDSQLKKQRASNPVSTRNTTRNGAMARLGLPLASFRPLFDVEKFFGRRPDLF